VTKFPTESRQVVGLEGEDYGAFKVGPTCSVPRCTRLTDHAHHLFSRGMMGGAFSWVLTPDGVEIGNLVPLCYRHHEQVTNNEIGITYQGGRFFWEGEPLTWQPPSKNGPEEVGTEPEERPICPGCGRRLPKPKIDSPTEEKKKRKTWAVSVPATVEEDGADVLDALLEAAREKMDEAGLDWGEGQKYFVLSTALGLFVQHADLIMSNG
jgi:hypothetical protein